MILLKLLLGILGIMVCALTYYLYREYVDCRRFNLGTFLYVILLLLVICTCVFCRMVKVKDSSFYERLECTEYHVTQKISDKGDTTYIIKYKPSL